MLFSKIHPTNKLIIFFFFKNERKTSPTIVNTNNLWMIPLMPSRFSQLKI